MPKKSITKKNRKGLKIKNKIKSRSRKVQKRLKRKKMRKSRKKQRGGADFRHLIRVSRDLRTDSYTIDSLDKLNCKDLHTFISKDNVTTPKMDEWNSATTSISHPNAKNITQISNYHKGNTIPKSGIFVKSSVDDKLYYLPKELEFIPEEDKAFLKYLKKKFNITKIENLLYSDVLYNAYKQTKFYLHISYLGESSFNTEKKFGTNITYFNTEKNMNLCFRFLYLDDEYEGKKDGDKIFHKRLSASKNISQGLSYSSKYWVIPGYIYPSYIDYNPRSSEETKYITAYGGIFQYFKKTNDEYCTNYTLPRLKLGTCRNPNYTLDLEEAQAAQKAIQTAEAAAAAAAEV